MFTKKYNQFVKKKFNESVDLSEDTINQESNDINQKLAELEDKYIRLYTEFENYKKSVQKEKEELEKNIKISLMSSDLYMDDDLLTAIQNIKDSGAKVAVGLIARKLENLRKSLYQAYTMKNYTR